MCCTKIKPHRYFCALLKIELSINMKLTYAVAISYPVNFLRDCTFELCHTQTGDNKTWLQKLCLSLQAATPNFLKTAILCSTDHRFAIEYGSNCDKTVCVSRQSFLKGCTFVLYTCRHDSKTWLQKSVLVSKTSYPNFLETALFCALQKSHHFNMEPWCICLYNLTMEPFWETAPLCYRHDNKTEFLTAKSIYICMYANTVQSDFAKRYSFKFCSIIVFSTSPLSTTV